MKNQLLSLILTLFGCHSILANSTPNKGQFDAWVNEFGPQARGSVTQEALEKGITGYLNHCGGGSCSCVLGIFDLDRSNF